MPKTEPFGKKIDYEHYHRSRPAQEPALTHQPHQAPEQALGRDPIRFERDRFKTIFNKCERLW